MNQWGCLPIVIFFILVILCPPLGLIFAFGYIWYLNFGKNNPNINWVAWLQIIGILFVLITCPIIFWLWILKWGIIYTLKEATIISIIAITEMIAVLLFFVQNYLDNKKK